MPVKAGMMMKELIRGPLGLISVPVEESAQYRTRQAAIADVREYVAVYYSSKRLHSGRRRGGPAWESSGRLGLFPGYPVFS